LNPKIVLFDIETSFNEGEYFGSNWETSILRQTRYWNLLSFSYKVLGESKTYVYGLPDFPGYEKDKRNDKALTQKLWDMANEADILIAHNGDQFDIKMMNVRFLHHKMEPPSPYQTIDTKKIAKGAFRFTSNKLDELARFLGIGHKTPHTGMQLWHDCDDGDMKAWALMKKYNRNDVILLEEVYLALRPWSKNHVNVNGWNDPDFCKVCGGSLWRVGTRYLTGGRQKVQYRCKSCGKPDYGQVLKAT
jgi:hypothetical protein